MCLLTLSYLKESEKTCEQQTSVYHSLQQLLKKTFGLYHGVIANHFMTQAGINLLLTDMSTGKIDFDSETDMRLESLETATLLMQSDPGVCV